MRLNKEKFFVFSCGVIFLFVFLELLLRLAGIINLPKTFNYLKGSKINGKRVVLCLGNSYTYGSGAPAGESYPDYLQKLINSEHKSNDILVVNGGICNLNTSELLNRIEGDLDKYNPFLVIIQTGSPNLWSTYYYNKYLKRNSRQHILGTLDNKVSFLLQKSKVYKFITMVLFCIKEKIDKNIESQNIDYQNFIKTGDYKKASEFWWSLQLGLLKSKPVSYDPVMFKDSLSAFTKATELSPNLPDNYKIIGDLYFFIGDYDNAAYWYIKGVKAAPYYRDSFRINTNYTGLKRVSTVSKNENTKKQIKNFILSFGNLHPQSKDKFIGLNNEGIFAWIESDLKEMIEILRKRRIEIILQNYPPVFPMGERYIKGVNESILKVANEMEVAFVDNEKIFLGMMGNSLNRKEYFNDTLEGLGHCNSNGYRLMAENIYRKMEEEHYLLK